MCFNLSMWWSEWGDFAQLQTVVERLQVADDREFVKVMVNMLIGDRLESVSGVRFIVPGVCWSQIGR